MQLIRSPEYSSFGYWTVWFRCSTSRWTSSPVGEPAARSVGCRLIAGLKRTRWSSQPVTLTSPLTPGSGGVNCPGLFQESALHQERAVVDAAVHRQVEQRPVGRVDVGAEVGFVFAEFAFFFFFFFFDRYGRALVCPEAIVRRSRPGTPQSVSWTPRTDLDVGDVGGGRLDRVVVGGVERM